MIKKLFFLIFTIAFATAWAQDNKSLQGRWKTISVTDSETFAAYPNDSIVLLDGTKRNKISTQDHKAHVRTTYARNIFVFTGANDFFQYFDENPRTLTFDGNYTVTANGNLTLNLKNLGRIDVKIAAKYYLENDKLHLTMYADRIHPIEYVLERTPE